MMHNGPFKAHLGYRKKRAPGRQISLAGGLNPTEMD